jgi:mono/diheme cytochrome c family protein
VGLSLGPRRLAAALGLACLVGACAGPAPAEPPAAAGRPGAGGQPAATAAWLARGAQLYARECASCHGARGEGQPNWAVPLPDGSLPAPPHDATGHTWHHADGELLDIVERGGTIYLPGSKMPAFGDKLDAADRRAVLDHIKTFWGPRERDYQASITLQRAAEAAPARPEPTER